MIALRNARITVRRITAILTAAHAKRPAAARVFSLGRGLEPTCHERDF